MENKETIKYILARALKQESDEVYYFLNQLVRGAAEDPEGYEVAYNPIFINEYNLGVIVRRDITDEHQTHLKISFQENSKATEDSFIFDVHQPITVYQPWYRDISIEGSLVRVKNCAKTCCIDSEGNLRVNDEAVHHSIVFDLINRTVWSETDKSVEESIDSVSVIEQEHRRVYLEKARFTQELHGLKKTNHPLYQALSDYGLYEFFADGNSYNYSYSYLLLYAVIKNPSIIYLTANPQFANSLMRHLVHEVVEKGSGCRYIEEAFVEGYDAYEVLNTESAWRPLMETDDERFDIVDLIKFRNSQLKYLSEVSGVCDLSRIQVLFDWMRMANRKYEISLGKLERLARDKVNIRDVIDYILSQNKHYGLRVVKGMEVYYKYYVMHYLLHGVHPTQFPPILRTAYDDVENQVYQKLDTCIILKEDGDVSKRITAIRPDLKTVIDGFEFAPDKDGSFYRNKVALEDIDTYGYENISVSLVDGKTIGGFPSINIVMSGNYIVRYSVNKLPKELNDAISKWKALHDIFDL